MTGQGKLITGMIVGAGAMYLLDPDRGARRRSLLRDRGVHAGHKLGDGLAATVRDTKNRTLGAAAKLRGRLTREQPDDEVLHDRVRSAIGRLVSHPGAVTVTAFQGRVTLTGHVLADEVDALLAGARRVRGVEELRNELEIHESAEGVPALQGAGRPLEHTPELWQENWAPATRLVVGSVAGLIALKGSRTRGISGKALGVLGLGLLARATTNVPPRRLVRLGSARRPYEVEKTITVAAPLEQVWELWSNFENFPRFMAHLKDVRKIDEDRSHWVAVGPAGMPVEWDAIVTDWVPRQFIGWTSVEGSSVETSGQVRFRPVSETETLLDVQLSYDPPAGADPKQAMDEDLLRLKSLLEDGQTSGGGEPVRLEEVVGGKKAPRRRGSAAAKGKS